MRNPAAYRLEVLRQAGDFTLYRGRAQGGAGVLALAVTGVQGSERNADRLAHENALAGELDAAWSARPLGLVHHEGRQTLLLEDSGGEPLDMLIEQGGRAPLETGRFLRIASELAGALGQMHRKGLIHKDIKPANVLATREGQVRLMGFGIASRLRTERQAPGPPEVIAGTFAYMAPEQTGRMNRSMDARSDLYSLGVTLYELLTGTLPFSASSPMEWIHCHIAKQAPAPSERVPQLAGAIDAIVLKLLAKNPEDRYSTAAGVEADLRHCLADWLAHGAIDSFVPGEHDVSDRLVMPEKLYGREAEIRTLLAAFERVVSHGTTELVLVSGYAGIGKSSLVNELHQALVPARGLFAAGKFDQYKRDIPYATLAQAFQSLVRQLLNKDDAELARWRDKLLAALGPNGELMVSLIPELALIIGPQPPVGRVEPQDAGARFYVVFRDLLRVFASHDHPLVLFLDDLQWLDPATLAFLQRLATDGSCGHLLLVGAYRELDVGQEHPLTRTVAAIRADGGVITQVMLAPLGIARLTELCAAALHTDTARVSLLAELVQEKTGGNPFFVIQFIMALADEGLLAFDASSRTWQWDVDRIRDKRITDNVADLMATKLGRLSAETRRTLGALACLGNSADLETVALLHGSSHEETRSSLREAVEAGLILPVDRSVAFIHDRVHEAAYALVPDNELAQTHLRIGRALLSRTPGEQLGDRIFEIVSQFERGAASIEAGAERDTVVDLYLLAGKRAKTSTAFASAQGYFAAGRALLGDQGWARRYRTTFELELNCAECEIINGELANAEQRLAMLALHAQEFGERADVVCLSVLLYFTTGRSEKAVEVALSFLSRGGTTWSASPTDSEVRQEYLQMHRRLAVVPADSLIDLPAMSDPTALATMAVLTELFPAAYAVDRYLLDFVLLRMTNLSLEHGNCESSSVAYSALNMVLGPHFGDYRTAYALGQLACELVDRRGMDRYKARVYSCFAAFTMPWVKHLPLCRPLMAQAFRVGSSTGDKAFAAYNSRNLMTHLLASGTALDQVQREAEQALAFAAGLQLGMPAERFMGQVELIEKLRGEVPDLGASGAEWDQLRVDERKPGLAMMICYHWVYRLQERFFAGDFRGALEASSHVGPFIWAMRSSLEEAEFEFYSAMAHAACSFGAEPHEAEHHLAALRKHHERISTWAANCPENFDNRRALVAAEIARLEGSELEAQTLYEEAIQSASRHGFIQNEALANEFAAAFYDERDLPTSADAHLREALACYTRWGARAKVNQLEARHPQLQAVAAPGSLTTTIDTPIAQLDVETVHRASQTLSSEMVLPSLLEKLMRLAVEHAGAERGLLVLLEAEEPYLEAEAVTNRGNVSVHVQRVRVTTSDLPRSILQYVLRTGERVVLDDASASGREVDDEYVHLNRPRSVLCLPIFKQSKVIGALYLENNLATRAFTADRVAVLDFLASQAAIWLENARLFSDLQRSEAWLKEAQHLSSTGSWYWRVASDTLEFSDQTCVIYGLDPAQTVTLEVIASRIHPEDIPILQEMIDIARGPATDLDYLYRARLPDMSVKHLHLVAHGTRDKDGELEYIGAIQDVTQRHLAEEALGKARSELAHVARVTTLGVLTASIAHEVNQPLAGIVNNASTCVRMLGAIPPNIEGAVETARRTIRDGHRASDVITRLRSLFGKKSASIESVDLNEAMREVIALSASELQRSRVALRSELTDALPRVAGDRVQLQQVILNLILNAADAMAEVDDRPRQLVVRTRLDQQRHVVVSVQDSGVGLEPDTVEKLFEAFYTTKSSGMGMGLSVSRSIIESHQGRLWAAPNAGPGATFAFSIPPQRASVPD